MSQGTVPEEISGADQVAADSGRKASQTVASFPRDLPPPGGVPQSPVWVAPDDLRPVYATIQTEMARVEQSLEEELSSRFPAVDELMKYSFRLGGKRMRPALVLLSAQATGPIRQEHILVGAVVEIIHTATLIHDDVLDEATLRRHLLTVNARWNTESSVLLGDYLFTHALCLATRLEDLFIYRLLGETARTLCEGELRQVQYRGNFQITEEEYLEIIWEKTAALCQCACCLGAYLAGASEAEREALRQYGSDLGVAFQITDDLLDLVGEEDAVGKSLGTDLAKKKLTLPLIHLLRQVEEPDRRKVLEILQQPMPRVRPELIEWLERTQAIRYTQQKAQEYIYRAQSQLTILSPSPARTALAQLADFVLSRRH